MALNETQQKFKTEIQVVFPRYLVSATPIRYPHPETMPGSGSPRSQRPAASRQRSRRPLLLAVPLLLAMFCPATLVLATPPLLVT